MSDRRETDPPPPNLFELVHLRTPYPPCFPPPTPGLNLFILARPVAFDSKAFLLDLCSVVSVGTVLRGYLKYVNLC